MPDADMRFIASIMSLSEKLLFMTSLNLSEPASGAIVIVLYPPSFRSLRVSLFSTSSLIEESVSSPSPSKPLVLSRLAPFPAAADKQNLLHKTCIPFRNPALPQQDRCC